MTIIAYSRYFFIDFYIISIGTQIEILFVCFNLGFALLQTDSSAPALPPEGGFGTPQ